MKRIDLIRAIEDFGCVPLRRGAKQDIYNNPHTGKTQPAPRHKEINEVLARKVIRDLSNETD